MALSIAACAAAPVAPAAAAPAAEAPAEAVEAPAEAAEVEWPTTGVQLIVPATAGGLADRHARIVADYLQKETGGSFAVVNQPDGGGVVAYDTVNKAKPDGNILLFYHSNFLINCATGMYDASPIDDFTTIAALESGGDMIVVTRADSPYQTLEDYVNDALARPGEVSFGIQAGGASHFLAGLLSKDKKIEFNLIEVGNETEKVQALLGGFVDACHLGPAAARQYIDSGDLRVLCSSGSKVDPNFPDFIPAAEQGLPSAIYVPYFWLMGPKGMDPALVEKINAAFKNMETDADVAELLKGQASSYEYKDIPESEAFMKEQWEMHLDVGRDLGLVQ